MLRNITDLDNSLIARALTDLRQRLPERWRIDVAREPAGDATGRRPDALARLRAPDGTAATLLIEAKRSPVPRDVAQLVDRARSRKERTNFLFVAPFLTHSVRRLLAEAGWNYLDLTGNARLVLDRPALYVETRGAERSPWREERPARSLKGPKAGRIVRTLCDFRPPFGVRELAAKAGTDPGYVSRVLDLLDQENLIARERRGPVTRVEWQQLIRRWAQDYSVLRSHRAVTYLEPRGLSTFVEKLRARRLGPQYAITGSLGASRFAPVAPERLAMMYVNDAEAAGSQLELRPAESGANVILLEPFDPVVYERTWKDQGVTFAARSQIAADLLTSPGRGPSEAEAVLSWMAENERAWRT